MQLNMHSVWKLLALWALIYDDDRHAIRTIPVKVYLGQRAIYVRTPDLRFGLVRLDGAHTMTKYSEPTPAQFRMGLREKIFNIKSSTACFDQIMRSAK
jgi:hypothetical protein